MKMEFLFSGLFWGIVILFVGASIIVNAVFGVDIPVFRIVIGLAIIYFGLRIIVGGAWLPTGKSATVFREAGFAPAGTPEKEYSTVFGSCRLDLRGVALTNEPVTVKSSTVFGQTRIKVDPAMPVRVEFDAAFGNARDPEGRQTAFGKQTWQSKSYSADKKKALVVDASVVFGEVVVETK